MIWPRKREWLLYGLLFLVVLAVSTGWTISFLVRSAGDVDVPSMVGSSVAEAKHDLEGKKLSLEVIGAQFSDDVPTGNIVAQSIPVGERVRQGRTVGVEISKGAREQIAPQVTGLRRSAATAVLKASDLEAIDLAKSCSDTIPQENIVAQSPEPGEMVRGGKIELLISSGPCTNRFVMPRVVGSSMERIAREFEQQGFQSRSLKDEVRDDATPGTIVVSTVETGAIIRPSDSLAFTVALAPSPPPVPSFLPIPGPTEEVIIAPPEESTPE